MELTLILSVTHFYLKLISKNLLENGWIQESSNFIEIFLWLFLCSVEKYGACVLRFPGLILLQ